MELLLYSGYFNSNNSSYSLSYTVFPTASCPIPFVQRPPVWNLPKNLREIFIVKYNLKQHFQAVRGSLNSISKKTINSNYSTWRCSILIAAVI